MTLVGGIENPGSSATGTVTNTSGALTNNAVVLGNGTNDIKTVTGFTTDGTHILTVSTAGNGAGTLALSGNTSGTVTLAAPAIAGTATNPVLLSNALQFPNTNLVGINFNGGVTERIYGDASGNIIFDEGSNPIFALVGSHPTVRFNQVLGWAPTSTITGTPDIAVSRFGANILAVGINATGANKAGLIQSGMSTFVTSNFTTSGVGTALEAITGLSITVPAVAANWTFHAHLSYSQAVGNAAVAFGIQAVTNNPTNIFAQGTQQITVGPPATLVTGTLVTLATTTATNIVSGTPGAITTNYVVDLYGTCELAATANTIRLLVSTATAADLVTILRGSYLHFNC